MFCVINHLLFHFIFSWSRVYRATTFDKLLLIMTCFFKSAWGLVMMVVTVEGTSWAVLFLEENTHQSGPNALGRLFNHSSLTGMFSNYNLSRLLQYFIDTSTDINICVNMVEHVHLLYIHPRTQLQHPPSQFLITCPALNLATLQSTHPLINPL